MTAFPPPTGTLAPDRDCPEARAWFHARLAAEGYTPTQQRILWHLCRGLTDGSTLAHACYIAPHTLHNALTTVYRRFGWACGHPSKLLVRFWHTYGLAWIVGPGMANTPQAGCWRDTRPVACGKEE